LSATQPSQVDPDQQYAAGGQWPSDAQHGAVSADGKLEVALRADLLDFQCPMVAQADAVGCLLLQRHPAALAGQGNGRRPGSYEVDGQVVGTLGIIGSLRMLCDKMIQIVSITSKL